MMWQHTGGEVLGALALLARGPGPGCLRQNHQGTLIWIITVCLVLMAQPYLQLKLSKCLMCYNDTAVP